MKKCFIKVSRILAEVIYLDEENNKLIVKDRLIPRYRYIYETNDVEFEFKNDKSAEKLKYLFDDERVFSGNKKNQYIEILTKYIDFLLKLVEVNSEIIFVSCFNDSNINNVLVDVLPKFKRNNLHIKLLLFSCLVYNFVDYYFDKKNKIPFLYFDDATSVIVYDDQYGFNENSAFSLLLPTLTQHIKNEYYKKIPRFLLSNIDHSDYGDFIDSKVKDLLYSNLIYQKNDSYIYCRDYRVKINEFENDDYMKFMDFSVINDEESFYPLLIKNKTIYLVTNFNNKAFQDQIIDNFKSSEIIDIDVDRFLLGLYKYFYNVAIINEQYKLNIDHVLIIKKGRRETIMMYKQLGYDCGLFTNIKEILKKYPQFKSLILEIEDIKYVREKV